MNKNIIQITTDCKEYAERVKKQLLLEPALLETFFNSGINLLLERIPPRIEQDVCPTMGTNYILLRFR